jgi:molecular chaperone DnaJ
MSKNYYEILGVNKNATEKEIKKAFKQLSLKWHPDRWATASDAEKKEAEEKFKDINEAHSILSDKEKRQNYDNFGDPNGGPSWSGMNWGGMGGFDDFFSSFNRGAHSYIKKGDNAFAKVFVTLDEIYKGGKKTVTYERYNKCSHCDGKGYDENGLIETCPICNGSGRIRKTTRKGYSTFIQETICHNCKGVGYTIKNPCKECNGLGLKEVTENIDIDIPIGIYDKARISVGGMGSYPSSVNGGECVNGDLIIEFNEIKHDTYSRNGDDIMSTIKLNLYEALCGTEVILETIDGGKIKFKVPKLTKDGHVFRFAGKGLKSIMDNNHRGNHLVLVSYEYPTEIGEREEKLLKELCNVKQ